MLLLSSPTFTLPYKAAVVRGDLLAWCWHRTSDTIKILLHRGWAILSRLCLCQKNLQQMILEVSSNLGLYKSTILWTHVLVLLPLLFSMLQLKHKPPNTQGFAKARRHLLAITDVCKLTQGRNNTGQWNSELTQMPEIRYKSCFHEELNRNENNGT